MDLQPTIDMFTKSGKESLLLMMNNCEINTSMRTESPLSPQLDGTSRLNMINMDGNPILSYEKKVDKSKDCNTLLNVSLQNHTL